ncbi:MAG: hypothetical protein J3R72DRAFT_514850 [Linnemannia gamsii]|nr:MAG: hypothetical protein J3R72DRAFT_514850 [Linnemannia gamsii]
MDLTKLVCHCRGQFRVLPAFIVKAKSSQCRTLEVGHSLRRILTKDDYEILRPTLILSDFIERQKFFIYGDIEHNGSLPFPKHSISTFQTPDQPPSPFLGSYPTEPQPWGPHCLINTTNQLYILKRYTRSCVNSRATIRLDASASPPGVSKTSQTVQLGTLRGPPSPGNAHPVRSPTTCLLPGMEPQEILRPRYEIVSQIHQVQEQEQEANPILLALALVTLERHLAATPAVDGLLEERLEDRLAVVGRQATKDNFYHIIVKGLQHTDPNTLPTSNVLGSTVLPRYHSSGNSPDGRYHYMARNLRASFDAQVLERRQHTTSKLEYIQ